MNKFKHKQKLYFNGVMLGENMVNDIFINNNCIFVWFMIILMLIFAYINL